MSAINQDPDPISCFLEGTLITCYENDQEIVKKVETIDS